eukprot:12642249-Alexandrium_andersonii.AAC.2
MRPARPAHCRGWSWRRRLPQHGREMLCLAWLGLGPWGHVAESAEKVFEVSTQRWPNCQSNTPNECASCKRRWMPTTSSNSQYQASSRTHVASDAGCRRWLKD